MTAYNGQAEERPGSDRQVRERRAEHSDGVKEKRKEKKKRKRKSGGRRDHNKMKRNQTKERKGGRRARKA